MVVCMQYAKGTLQVYQSINTGIFRVYACYMRRYIKWYCQGILDCFSKVYGRYN